MLKVLLTCLHRFTQEMKNVSNSPGRVYRYLDKSRNYRKKLSPKNCAVILDCRRGLICGDRLFVLVSSSVMLAIFYKGSPWLLLAFAIRCIR